MAHRLRHLPLPLRVVRARVRLFSALGLGILVSLVLAFVTDWRPVTRCLVGWDVMIGVYLMLVAHVMLTADVADIRAHAAEQDEGRTLLLVLTVAAALASLAAIVLELGGAAGGGRSPAALTLAIGTIGLSWTFIHTIFALHYAHEFYDELGGGLTFPGDAEPDYWDFVYFSFVIGMTSQVSDVAVTGQLIRRTVAAHGVIAFAFNVALLALTINIAAGML